MPLTLPPNREATRRNEIRRIVLGRLMEARKRLSSKEGQKAQRIVNGTIRELQALLKVEQDRYGPYTRTSPDPIAHAVMLHALQNGRDLPLVIAYHVLTQDHLGNAQGAEIGMLRKCRQACRDACIAAGLGDPIAA